MKLATCEAAAIVLLAAAACLAQGTITTAAGTATCCNSADGGSAVSTWLPAAGGVTVDRAGNLYIWDTASSKIRKVNSAGIISTVAGNGTPGFSGDGGPATSAQLFANGSVSGLAVDPAGNLFISDGQNQRVRKVDTAGIITTVAGNGTSAFSGDGGLATSASLFYPAGIAVEGKGNLYIADSSNNRVRKVNSAGIISTVAGNGNVQFSGDGGPAAAAGVDRPEGVAVDGAGNLYISETSQSRVRKVDAAGIIRTLAGQTTKTNGFSGDGGPATAATLFGPIGLAVDNAGNVFIADNVNGRVRKVDAAGIITTYAGNGNSGSSGDGGAAASASIGVPKDVALDSAGNLYIAGSNRVRKVSAGSSPLSVSPSSLSFSYTIGGAVPVSQTLTISSSQSAVSFTAAAVMTSGNNWLTVSPGSGTTPGTLTVTVAPAGLAGGVYAGAITVTPGGAGSSPLSFSVSLTVTAAGAPVISSNGIVNATGYQNKLAPDTVFVIFGSAMGPASLAAATGPNYPTALAGTSVTFTPAAGGNPIDARMVYSVAGQVAGLLPSSITPGTYSVRVTYNTLASAPQSVTVVSRSFGIATANSAGSGTAQATIGNINGGVSLVRFTSGSVAFGGHNWTLSPAHPGDTLVLWGTGGGADAANDSGGTSGDQTHAGGFVVTVGGRQITPLYAGASSGYPGLWQINFTLPGDIAPDCFATVQVTSGGEVSNPATVPIAAGGQSACSDPQLSSAALAVLDAGGTITGGGFGISRVTLTNSYIASPGAAPTTTNATQESVGGGVARFTAAEYAAIFAGTQYGACKVTDRTASSTARNPASPDGYLDVGATIPASGPGLPASPALTVMSANPGPIYGLLLANGTIAGGGKYALSGKGGKDLGPFNVAVTFPAGFTVTNWDSITGIDRGQALAVNWTGGGGSDQVYLIASSSAVVGKDASNTLILHNVVITCQVPASAGTMSVPAAALAYLVPGTLDAASVAKGTTILAVELVANQPFTAPLVSGGSIDWGGFTATISVAKNLPVQ